MFLFPVLLALSQQIAHPKVWFGPVTATFETQFGGDQYDTDLNDVRVKFVARDGKSQQRPAYYEDGVWKAVLVTLQPGEYTPFLIRNGVELPDIQSIQGVVSATRKLAHGFIHVDPGHPNRFAYDDGTPYFPVGTNVSTTGLKNEIAKMKEATMNYGRLGARSALANNPFWPSKESGDRSDRMWEPALNLWGDALATFDLYDMPVQVALFSGEDIDPARGWPRNPWNSTVGGFLDKSDEFFTSPEAKRREKEWLRYCVARFGWDPNLFAYELFDDIEKSATDWATVLAWETEMLTYISSLDSYDHMVTISAVVDRPEIAKLLDFYQPHSLTAAPPIDKPSFINELDPGKQDLLSSLFESVFANLGGASITSAVDWAGGQSSLKAFAKTVGLSNVALHPTARRLPLQVAAGKADGIGSSDWMLARIQAPRGPLTLTGISTADGEYDITWIDLLTGEVKKETAKLRDYRFTSISPFADCSLILSRRS